MHKEIKKTSNYGLVNHKLISNGNLELILLRHLIEFYLSNHSNQIKHIYHVLPSYLFVA
jgi:hypothetical protein